MGGPGNGWRYDLALTLSIIPSITFWMRMIKNSADVAEIQAIESIVKFQPVSYDSGFISFDSKLEFLSNINVDFSFEVSFIIETSPFLCKTLIDSHWFENIAEVKLNVLWDFF